LRKLHSSVAYDVNLPLFTLESANKTNAPFAVSMTGSGAMLSPRFCKIFSEGTPPRKHADFAKLACFRGNSALFSALQAIRESMAPLMAY